MSAAATRVRQLLADIALEGVNPLAVDGGKLQIRHRLAGDLLRVSWAGILTADTSAQAFEHLAAVAQKLKEPNVLLDVRGALLFVSPGDWVNAEQATPLMQRVARAAIVCSAPQWKTVWGYTVTLALQAMNSAGTEPLPLRIPMASESAEEEAVRYLARLS